MIILKCLLFTILAILCLLAIISVLKLSFWIEYKESTKFFVGIGPLKINLMRFLTKKQKKPKIISLYKTLESKEKNAGKKQKQKQTTVKKEPKQQGKDIGFVLNLVKNIIGLFFKHLKIKLCKIKAVIATEDAAKTAILYGSVTAALSSLYAVLQNVENFELCSKKYSVTTDFIKQKSEFDIEIKFSVYVWQALVCILKAFALYMRKDKKYE